MKKTSVLNPFIHFSSLLCVIHCLLAPFIIAFSPFLGSFFEYNMVKFGLLGFSILCGVFIVYNGYCTHKKQHAMALFILGGILWTVQTLLEVFHIHTSEIYLYIGTICVLGAYYINHHYIKCCKAPCCDK